MNFCKEMNFQLMKLSKKILKLWMLLLFPCLGTIPVPSAPFLWLHRGSIVPPLHCPYDGLYAILLRGPSSFTIRVGSRDEIVSVSHLKACTEANATSGSPQRHGRPPGKHKGGPTTTKQVSFSDPLVSSPSFPVPPQNSLGTVFLPGEEVFAHPGPAVL
jgi:hypothetical protein